MEIQAEDDGTGIRSSLNDPETKAVRSVLRAGMPKNRLYIEIGCVLPACGIVGGRRDSCERHDGIEAGVS
jgi:hypothetical protein